MLANKRRKAAQLSSPYDSFASVPLKIFDGNTMLNISHCRIIRRNGAQPTVRAAGASTLRAGPMTFTSSIGAALRVIPALQCSMVRALAGVVALRRCTAPPGSMQEPLRRMVPPRWGSGLAVSGVEGGAA